MNNLKQQIIDVLADETTFFDETLFPEQRNDAIRNAVIYILELDEFAGLSWPVVEQACREIVDDLLK